MMEMETLSRDFYPIRGEKNKADEDIAGIIASNIRLGHCCSFRSVETDAFVLSFQVFY